jgi:enamine deaminase RidA (YjgF/YER057c/UK114 family)
MKQSRNPTDVHQPLAAYAHQIEITGPERLLVLSGQVGMAVDGALPESPIEQLDLAWTNLERNLDTADMAIGDLVKLTLYLVGDMDPDERRRLLAAKLGDHRPCMTLLFVASLASPALKVEIDAWASQADR